MNKVTLYNEQIGGYLVLSANRTISQADIVDCIGHTVNRDEPYEVNGIKVSFSVDLPTEKPKEVSKEVKD